MDSTEPTKCNLCYCVCCKKIIPQRHVLTTILVIAPVLLYMQRVCLNLAIVNMTNWDPPPIELSEHCTRGTNSTKDKIPINDQQFDWDESIQSYILLSFFVGYMIGNCMIGFIINYIGGRICLLTGVALSSVMTMAIPWAAYYTHWSVVCLVRVISGIGQSSLFSSATTLVSRWHTEKTKSSASTLILNSFTIGIIIGNVSTGYLMYITHAWCYVFYVMGGCGLIWAIFFFFYVYRSPQDHPHVTSIEVEFLKDIPKPRKTKVPVGKMLQDLSVWMFFLAYFGSDFTLYLLLTNMPKYFVTVLGYSIAVTGIILMAPPIASAIGGFIIGPIADIVITKQLMKKLHFRMICSTVGLIFPPACLMLVVLSRCNDIMVIVMITLCMFFQCTYYAGVGIMAVDLTLNYTGILFGFCNVAGGFAGSMAPYLVGSIAFENTFHQWDIVMLIANAIAIATVIPILLFSKANRKPWDYSDDETPPPPDDAPRIKKIWSCYQPV